MIIRKAIQFAKHKLFDEQLDFRVRMFNAFAFASLIISFTSTLITIGEGQSVSVIFIIAQVILTLTALGLLIYDSKSGDYQLCHMIIIGVFLIYLPLLFLVSRGFKGAMPLYFIFAIVSTVFMLEGRKAIGFMILELFIYSGLCVYGYLYPERFMSFETERAALTRILVGIISVGASLGITVYVHFRMYINQQRQLETAREEALKLSKVKSTFLANMSHEIRTPINVMLGMTEMILRESKSEQIIDYGANIQSAGKTLLTLINNILDISKIESGKLELIEEAYKPADLIRELTVMGMERAQRRGLRFIVEVDEKLPCELLGDFIHLKQVVVNFISNAVKYTEKGSVTLRFTHKCSEGGGIVLCIAVIDTGIGIKTEDLSILFDAFTRVDLQFNREVEGTGLGLAIAKELAELMGGHIDVKSTLGVGSEFTIEVLQSIQDATPIGTWQLADTKTFRLRQNSFIAPCARILIVDDNQQNIMVLKNLVARTMITIDAVLSGPECLHAVKENHYDMIFMDYMMPEMDGIQTLYALKQCVDFKTPVVALTANTIIGSEQMFLREGFAGYVTKPIVWGELVDVMLNYLPDQLITKTGSGEYGPIIPDEIMHELEQDLAAYDISIKEGLSYISGDLLQYKKLAEIYTENHPDTLVKATKLTEQKDWAGLEFTMHALKSRARAAGAIELGNIAARLEERCNNLDGAYIEAAMPLLYLEWERAYQGLLAFMRRLELLGSLDFSTQADKIGIDLHALHAHIRSYRRIEAQNDLEKLIVQAADDDSRNRLKEALHAVMSLDFDDAQLLLETEAR